jgi:hypothetical protein
MLKGKISSAAGTHRSFSVIAAQPGSNQVAEERSRPERQRWSRLRARTRNQAGNKQPGGVWQGSLGVGGLAGVGGNSIPGGLIHFLQHRREPHIPKPYLHAQCGIMREAIGGTWIDGKPKLG